MASQIENTKKENINSLKQIKALEEEIFELKVFSNLYSEHIKGKKEKSIFGKRIHVEI